MNTEFLLILVEIQFILGKLPCAYKQFQWAEWWGLSCCHYPTGNSVQDWHAICETNLRAVFHAGIFPNCKKPTHENYGKITVWSFITSFCNTQLGFLVSHVNVPGIMTGFYSPYGQGFHSKESNPKLYKGPSYDSIYAPGISYGGKSCENVVKFYYRTRAEYLFCGTLVTGKTFIAFK